MNRTQALYRDLRQQIVTGVIPHGRKISEPALAEQFQVSRTTLRDVLAALKAIGLLHSQPNVGYQIIALSSQHLLDLLDVREALESMACRQAARAISTAQLQQISVLLSTLDTAQSSMDVVARQERQLDVHYLIIRASNNPVLIDLLCEKLYFLLKMYSYQFGAVRQLSASLVTELEHIVHALHKRDSELAEFLMRRCIASLRVRVQQHFQTTEKSNL